MMDEGMINSIASSGDVGTVINAQLFDGNVLS
jgi:hypothetical protein